MARKQSLTLTEAELPVMAALWKKSPASVGDVAETVGKERAVAYNTVLTILRILERKGYVRHTKDGRAFLYQPTVGRGQARRTAVRQLLARFFENSPELLMVNLLRDENIDVREIERLKKLVENE
jgi:predicted transcriptional regulator